MRTRHIRFAYAAVLMALAGCGTATFDSDAYQNTVQLKFETLTLIDRMGDRYAARKSEADALLRKYSDAADGAARQTNNGPVTEMWQAIRDPGGGSTVTVIELWRKGPLRPGTRAERKRLVAAHFDRLICLEAAKQSPKDCTEVGAAPSPSAASSPQPPPRPAAAPQPAEDGQPAEEPKPQ